MNRAAYAVVGTLAVAVAVSAGFVAAGGRSPAVTLSGKVTTQGKVPGFPSPSPRPSRSSPPLPSSGPSRSSLPLPSSRPSRSSRLSLPSPQSSASPSSAPWSSRGCPSQVASWRSSGAGGQLQVVVTDLAIASQAAASLHAELATGAVPPSAVAALRSAAASLGSGARVAGKDLIPGCVPGARLAEAAGLADLGRAVAVFGNAASAAGSGDYGAARRVLQAAVAAMQSGSARMAAAITDLKGYAAG